VALQALLAEREGARETEGEEATVS